MYNILDKDRYLPPESEESPAILNDCLLQGSIEGIDDLGEEEIQW